MATATLVEAETATTTSAPTTACSATATTTATTMTTGRTTTATTAATIGYWTSLTKEIKTLFCRQQLFLFFWNPSSIF